MKNFLDSNHPSVNTKTAAFLVSLPDGLAVVEAENPYAVQALELIAGDDQSFGPGLTLAAVFRDCGVIGLREGSILGMEYVDFLLRVVNPERMAHPFIQECIASSLSEKDKAYIAFALPDVSDDSDDEDRAEPEPETENKENVKEKLSAGLVGLGFHKARVTNHIAALGNAVYTTPLNDLMRGGILAMTS
jgi:hypothetical protein